MRNEPDSYAGGPPPVPGCGEGCDAKGPEEAAVKLLWVGPVNRDGERVSEWRCEGCGATIPSILDEDDVIPAHIPERPAGWKEDSRVHLRIGQREQEKLGERVLASGEVIDLTGPRWLGVVRDAVATLNELNGYVEDESDESGKRSAGYPLFLGTWWAGNTFCEEYPDLRVLHRNEKRDESVSICSVTTAGAAALALAAETRGISWPGREAFAA